LENYDLKKGLFYSILGAFLISLQPVIANSRPTIIDPYIFGAVTALIEALIFLPIYLLERKNLKKSIGKNPRNAVKIEILLRGWKKRKNVRLFIIIGLGFTIVPMLLYIGFERAGTINSALALKTELIFALIFGNLILNEKLKKRQGFFCILLFFGIILAVTQGSFNLVKLNIGVIIVIIGVFIFTFIHALTKISLEKNEIFSSQVVFIRNLFSGILLISTYFIFFPLENINILINPKNYIYFLLMGLDYGFALFSWYRALTYFHIGKITIIGSITPIITAFFSFLLLGEVFTWYHLIGAIIIVIAIIMIMRVKQETESNIL
jgi:drug/metabolite transporter (DMT)-like permease